MSWPLPLWPFLAPLLWLAPVVVIWMGVRDVEP